MRSKELHPDGTYANAVLEDESKDKICELMDALNIEKKVPKEDLHTTLMYSKKPCPTAMEMNNKSIPFEGKVKELKTWDTRDGATCLVAVLDCDDLKDMHKYIHSHYDATYDFPNYIPHITLSYDCGHEKYELPNDEYIVKYSTLNVRPLNPDWSGD